MLRRAIALVFALVLCSVWAFPRHWVMSACAAAPVPAEPKADDSVSPSATLLLQHRKIQKELKMTADQRIVIVDGLADIEEEYDKKMEALARKPETTDEEYEKLDQERQKGTEKFLAGAATNLTAAQRARLRQLDLWVRGPAAFTDPQVEKKLLLTDAQKKKATEAVERTKEELKRYFDGLGNENDDMRKKTLFEFRKARLKELENALTNDQKTAWAALLGDAPSGFVVDELWLKIEEDAESVIVPGKRVGASEA
jgi:hypothetical protein